MFSRPENLPYDGELTWDNNGWIIRAEGAQIEDLLTEVKRFIQVNTRLVTRNGVLEFEPLSEDMRKVLFVVQDRLTTFLELAAHNPKVKIPAEFEATMREIIGLAVVRRVEPQVQPQVQVDLPVRDAPETTHLTVRDIESIKSAPSSAPSSAGSEVTPVRVANNATVAKRVERPVNSGTLGSPIKRPARDRHVTPPPRPKRFKASAEISKSANLMANFLKSAKAPAKSAGSTVSGPSQGLAISGLPSPSTSFPSGLSSPSTSGSASFTSGLPGPSSTTTGSAFSTPGLPSPLSTSISPTPGLSSPFSATTGSASSTSGLSGPSSTTSGSVSTSGLSGPSSATTGSTFSTSGLPGPSSTTTCPAFSTPGLQSPLSTTSISPSPGLSSPFSATTCSASSTSGLSGPSPATTGSASSISGPSGPSSTTTGSTFSTSGLPGPSSTTTCSAFSTPGLQSPLSTSTSPIPGLSSPFSTTSGSVSTSGSSGPSSTTSGSAFSTSEISGPSIVTHSASTGLLGPSSTTSASSTSGPQGPSFTTNLTPPTSGLPGPSADSSVTRLQGPSTTTGSTSSISGLSGPSSTTNSTSSTGLPGPSSTTSGLATSGLSASSLTSTSGQGSSTTGSTFSTGVLGPTNLTPSTKLQGPSSTSDLASPASGPPGPSAITDSAPSGSAVGGDGPHRRIEYVVIDDESDDYPSASEGEDAYASEGEDAYDIVDLGGGGEVEAVVDEDGVFDIDGSDNDNDGSDGSDDDGQVEDDDGQGEDDEGDFELLKIAEVNNLYDKVSQPLQDLLDEVRSYLLPKIPSPTQQLMMSSPVFHDGFKVHLAWQDHLEKMVTGGAVETDREAWWFKKQIADIFNGSDSGPVKKKKIHDTLVMANTLRLPLGTEQFPRETALQHRTRIGLYEKWVNQVVPQDPIREHGTTAALRARIEFVKGDAHEVKKLLGMAERYRIMLRFLKISGESSDERTTRLDHEKCWAVTYALSPEQRLAFNQARRRRMLANPNSRALYDRRVRARGEREKRRRWADEKFRNRRNGYGRKHYHLHKDFNLRKRVSAELEAIAVKNTSLLGELNAQSCDDHQKIDYLVSQRFDKEKHAIFATEECKRIGAAAKEAVYEKAIAEALAGKGAPDVAKVRQSVDGPAGNAGWEAERAYTYKTLAERTVVPPGFKVPKLPLRLEGALLEGSIRVKMANGKFKPISDLKKGDTVLDHGVPFTLSSAPSEVTCNAFAAVGLMKLIDSRWVQGSTVKFPELDGRRVELREPVDWKWKESDTPADDPLDKILKDIKADVPPEVFVPGPIKKRFWCCVFRLLGKYIADGSATEPSFAVNSTDSYEQIDYHELASSAALHCEVAYVDRAIPQCLKSVMDQNQHGRHVILCCADELHKTLRDHFEDERFTPNFKGCNVLLFGGAHTRGRARETTDSWFWKLLNHLGLQGFKKADIDPKKGEGLKRLLKIMVDSDCKDYTFSLIAGLIDGDGHKSKGTSRFSTAYENVRDFYVALCRSVGIVTKEAKSNTEGTQTIKGAKCKVRTLYTLSFSGNGPGERAQHFNGLPRKGNRRTREFELKVQKSTKVKSFYALPLGEHGVHRVILENGIEVPVAVVE